MTEHHKQHTVQCSEGCVS